MNRFKSRKPSCVLCGESNIVALTPWIPRDIHYELKAGSTICLNCRSVLLNEPITEEHHISGMHEGETVVVDKNTHAKLSFEGEH